LDDLPCSKGRGEELAATLFCSGRRVASSRSRHGCPYRFAFCSGGRVARNP